LKARHRNTNSFVPLIVFHFNFGKAKGQLRTVPGTVRKVGLNVNNPQNLISIKTGLHRRLHTNKYYETINNIMNYAYNKKYSYKTNRKRVIAALDAIKVWLKTKSFFSPF